MILSRQELTQKNKQIFTEKIIISPEQIKNNQMIISVDNLLATVIVEYISSLTMVKVNIKGKMVLRSTRTLRPVDYDVDINDDFIVCYNQEDIADDSMILLEGDSLDLNEYFYSIIIASIPLKVIAPDDEESFVGEDWEVITEDEYNRRKKSDESTSPFAALKDLDL